MFLHTVPPPTVTVMSSGRYYLGLRANLSCTVVSIPEVDSGNVEGVFRWYSNGEEITNGERFQITQVGRLMNELGVLSLSPMDTSLICSASVSQPSFGRISPPTNSSYNLTGFQCKLTT